MDSEDIKMKQQHTMMGSVFMLILILVSINGIFAFAISSAYYSDNPLYMKAGETQDIFLTLQNLAGSEEVSVRAEITGGTEYVQLIDASDIYLVPVGEKTKVNMRVSAPLSAKKGDSFPVNILFTTVKSGEGGTLAIASSIGQGFTIVIGEERDFIVTPEQVETPSQEIESPLSSVIMYVVIGCVLVLIVLYFLKSSKKKANARKKFQR